MKLPIYVLDAFTSEVFRGNPAAVVVSERALPVDLMQAIAAENNLAETAFVVPQGSIFTIRWFTPTVEIDLCGHATLAAAAALRKFGHTASDVIDFTCASGPLTVTRTGDRLALDFPARPAEPREVTPEVIDALGAVPAELHQAKALVPAKAGPLNSHQLVHQSLSLMHELSPEYLQHFMAHVDALLWLDGLGGAGRR